MGHCHLSRPFFSRDSIPTLRGLVSVFVLAPLLALPVQSRASDNHEKGRIILYSYGPARLQVTSPDGSRAGADLATGEYLEEIAGSDVTVERAQGRSEGLTLTLSAAAPGVYRLDLLGTGMGRVVVDVEIRDAAGRVSRSHVLQRIKAGDTLRYALDFNPAPGSVHRLEGVPD